MIVLLGAVLSRYPFVPGSVWHRIHYAIGLQRLGHDVYYVEELRPEWCVDAEGRRSSFVNSQNRQIFQTTMERFGLLPRACQVYNRGEQTCGLSWDALCEVARRVDLVINMSGHLTTEELLPITARRVYVDQDPVYTQLWSAEYGKDLNFSAHDVFVSVGLNIGTPRSLIPDCGLTWHHTLPPLVLDDWPWTPDRPGARWTTIASWSGYGDLCYRGEWYRSKYEEFVRFANLPNQAGQECEVALKAFGEDDSGIRQLRAGGWLLSQAAAIADLSAYQDYIAASRGEIGIAKNAYVKGRSGWFSDRAAHYLASGRPVLAEATGFERCLPTGQGLLAFGTVEEAVSGMKQVAADYATHCRAAREVAAECLDYRKVLPRLLDLCAGGSTQ